jgi:1-deoxy-D-xylulose-5-phosphate synthase
MIDYTILSDIYTPDDLKKLPQDKLPQLCEEIRGFLIEKVSKTGGHLASNLGIVELSVALHYVFDSPDDHIMFDVGHQCYVHKLLTGRKDRFDSLRRLDGISGFLKPSESEHDCFVSGHASNSISAILGMARGDKLRGRNVSSVCVIGDGALTGGMAYEALNDAGRSGLPLVIILNDNDMSISKSVGGLALWLSRIRLKPKYFSLKYSTQAFLRKFGKAGLRAIERISDFKSDFKHKILPENIFSVLGFDYLGPADGNDIDSILPLLSQAKKLNRPVVIHLKTVKGKGYSYSEEAPDFYHGVSAFDSSKGTSSKSGLSFAKVFGDTMIDMSRRDDRVCAVTAAMDMGTGLSEYKQEFADRFFDVGIAEGHAVTMCAGMAKVGMIPVFAVYSTFLQRGYDQLLHDTALNGAHVVFGVDHTGSVGADGPTHHGLFDTSFLRSVPGMAIYAPSSYAELESALNMAVFDHTGPVAVKYPKGNEGGFGGNSFGKSSVCLLDGTDVTLVSYGIMINEALDAAAFLKEKGISASVVKINRLDAVDMQPIIASASVTNHVFVIEDCVRAGSVGEYIASELIKMQNKPAVHLLNFDDSFSEVGTTAENYRLHGIDGHGICSAVMSVLNNEHREGI